MGYFLRPVFSVKQLQALSVLMGLIGLSWGQVSVVQEQEKSLLWEISKPNSKHVSYLYGTIHIIPQDSFFVLPQLNRVIKKTDRLVLEMDLDEAMANPFALYLEIQQSFSMPEGQHYTDLFTASELEEIKESVKKTSMVSADNLDQYSPMLLSMMMESSGCDDKASAKTTSYEMYLTKRYKDNFRPITGLETLDDQLGFFASISLKEQAEYLLASIRSKETNCDKMSELVAAYRRQDLEKLLDDSGVFSGESSIASVLLDDRNTRWVPLIKKLSKKESILVAVGAGHLPGPKGLIAQLREAGYTVTSLNH